MADREQLRALVDSLPEGALESAQAYLKAIQIWPPIHRKSAAQERTGSEAR